MKGSIAKINESTLRVSFDPNYLLGKTAFVRDGDQPVQVVPGYSVKEIIACIAWAEVAHKAPHLFFSDITEITTTFKNGMYVINMTKGKFGLWDPK